MTGPDSHPGSTDSVLSIHRGPAAQPSWAFEQTVTAFDVPVTLRTNDEAIFHMLGQAWPPRSRPHHSNDAAFVYSVVKQLDGSDTTGPRRYVGYAGDTVFVSTDDEALLCDAFASAVRYDVSVTTTRWTFVHAAAVSWNGRAIVIPAPSTHGKSHLALALVRAGATYYSDDVLVLDGDGRVHPYRLPASIRRDAVGNVDRLPLQQSDDDPPPVPIGLVVSTAYEAGARWQPRRGTSAEAVLALLSQTVRARVAPGEVLQVLARAVEGATLLEGARGEAVDIASQLLEEIG